MGELEEHDTCTCPDCGWDPPDTHIYYVSEGKAIDCTYWNEENSLMYMQSNAPNGKKVYPINEGVNQYSYFGDYSWTEIHLCPNCNKEFEFQNGT